MPHSFPCACTRNLIYVYTQVKFRCAISENTKKVEAKYEPAYESNTQCIVVEVSIGPGRMRAEPGRARAEFVFTEPGRAKPNDFLSLNSLAIRDGSSILLGSGPDSIRESIKK